MNVRTMVPEDANRGNLPSSPMVLVGAFWLGAAASSADAVANTAPIAIIETIVRMCFIGRSSSPLRDFCRVTLGGGKTLPPEER